MRNYKLTTGSILICLIVNTTVVAQTPVTPPQVGKPMPDFTLTNLRNFKTQTASLKDFKGKWLFLDFWNTLCTTCVKSFAKVDKMSEEFKDELTWVMVGMNDRYSKGMVEFYERFSKIKHLRMPAAFDSTLHTRVDISGVPHILMIDPSGVLYGISNGADFTPERIRDLLDGKKVDFMLKNRRHSKFDPAFLLGSGGGGEFYSGTVVTKWNGQDQETGFEVMDAVTYSDTGSYSEVKQIMIPLFGLYDLAYLGKWGWINSDSLYNTTIVRPVLELSDSSKFTFSYTDSIGKGLYNFYARFPGKFSTREHMQLLQEELKQCFGYTARVEKRMLPVWCFEATAEAEYKLRSKGGQLFHSEGSTAAGLTVRNFPIKRLLSSMSYLIQGDMSVPFFDRTGVSYLVDFSIAADMTTIGSVQKALENTGLRLVKSRQEMNVVVIRDRKNP